jgi:hypothetical protein
MPGEIVHQFPRFDGAELKTMEDLQKPMENLLFYRRAQRELPVGQILNANHWIVGFLKGSWSNYIVKSSMVLMHFNELGIQ